MERCSPKHKRFLIVHSSLVIEAEKLYGASFEIIDEQSIGFGIDFGFERKIFNPRSAFEHIQKKNKKRGVA